MRLSSLGRVGALACEIQTLSRGGVQICSKTAQVTVLVSYSRFCGQFVFLISGAIGEAFQGAKRSIVMWIKVKGARACWQETYSMRCWEMVHQFLASSKCGLLKNQW